MLMGGWFCSQSNSLIFFFSFLFFWIIHLGWLSWYHPFLTGTQAMSLMDKSPTSWSFWLRWLKRYVNSVRLGLACGCETHVAVTPISREICGDALVVMFMIKSHTFMSDCHIFTSSHYLSPDRLATACPVSVYMLWQLVMVYSKAF